MAPEFLLPPPAAGVPPGRQPYGAPRTTPVASPTLESGPCPLGVGPGPGPQSLGPLSSDSHSLALAQASEPREPPSAVQGWLRTCMGAQGRAAPEKSRPLRRSLLAVRLLIDAQSAGSGPVALLPTCVGRGKPVLYCIFSLG